MNNKLFITKGHLGAQVEETNSLYFRECASAGHGRVAVELPDGTTHQYAGTRWLGAVRRVRADVVNGHLHVRCHDVVLRDYPAWREYTVTAT